jgi:hypothetical protein
MLKHPFEYTVGFIAASAIACIAIAIGGNVFFLEMLPAFSTVATVSGVLIALRVYLTSVERHRHDDSRNASKSYLDEALKLLERAEEIFTAGGTAPPSNSRLHWLSTARMIVRYQQMKAKITQTDHKTIADGAEENTRLRFYTLLGDANSAGQLGAQYFCPSGNVSAGDNIARNSIAVILAFTRWPEESLDPLDSVDDEELFAKKAIPLMFRGALEHMEKHTAYWKRVLERRARLEGGRAAKTNHT